MYTVTCLGLVLCVLLVLIRAVKGPTVFDRILAVNAMGTLTVLLIAVVGFLNGRPEWLDLALIYALLNFVGVLAVLKFSRFGNIASSQSEIESLFPWK